MKNENMNMKTQLSGARMEKSTEWLYGFHSYANEYDSLFLHYLIFRIGRINRISRAIKFGPYSWVEWIQWFLLSKTRLDLWYIKKYIDMQLLAVNVWHCMGGHR